MIQVSLNVPTKIIQIFIVCCDFCCYYTIPAKFYFFYYLLSVIEMYLTLSDCRIYKPENFFENNCVYICTRDSRARKILDARYNR